MDYIHGYSEQEQERLIQQAEYWRTELILKDIAYQAEEKLLEIGCGAGAVLGILGQTFSGLKLSGIDLEPKQIEYATQYLNRLGLDNADLKIGNATTLPWSNNNFDHIYTIWFLEHLPDPLKVLKEARRVLKLNGTITITETDYRTFLVTPESSEYRYLIDSLCELMLLAKGKPYIGQSLGILLNQAGFRNADNQPFSVHHATSLDSGKLAKFVEYVDFWLASIVKQAVDELGKDTQILHTGLDWFRSICDRDDGAVSATIYRATAIC